MLCTSKITLKISALIAAVCAAFRFSLCGDGAVVPDKDSFYPKQLKCASKFRKLAFTAILLVIMSMFFSCGDDPTNSNEPNNEIPVIDSNLFDWSFIPVAVDIFNDVYVSDTDHIFYIGDDNAFLCDGTSSTQIYLNAASERQTNISGNSVVNVYLGGSISVGSVIFPSIKRWNGTSVEHINIPVDSGNIVLDLYVTESGVLWYFLSNGETCMYDGIHITKYQLGIEFDNVTFFENQTGLYVSVLRGIESGKLVHTVLEFSSDHQWNLVCRDTTIYNFNYSGSTTFAFNRHFVRRNTDYIDFFNGKTWDNRIPTTGFQAFSISGNSMQDFMVMGESNGTLNTNSYYYDGSTWFHQSNLKFPEYVFANFPITLSSNKGVYFGFFYALQVVAHNYILIGRKMNTPPVK